jgi:acyl-CoA synthetase (AMP-forming)/AMP-acid ligase II
VVQNTANVAGSNNDLRAILLFERWASVLRKARGHALVGSDGRALRTWSEIEQESQGFLKEVQGDESPVALQVGNHASFPALLLACWRADRAVCLLDAGSRDPARGDVERRIGIGLRIEAFGDELVFNKLDSGKPTPEGIVLYKLTSGTTSVPQPIGFRGEQIVADCDQVCATMGIGGDDLNFGVIAFSHSYGFSNLITPLLCRGVPLVVAEDALPRAIQFGLERTGATVLPLVPAMFRALCAVDSLSPSLRLCISAGAPLETLVARQFRERFGRKIHSFYGASECGGICYDRSESIDDRPGFVGEPMLGVKIEWIGSPQDSGSRIRVFSAAAAGDGTFEPSDLLARAGDGFRIVGREDDLMNCGGKKVAPAELERVLMTCPGISEGVVFGVRRDDGSDRIHALVVAPGGMDPAVIRAHCAGQLATWQIPREIHSVGKIPRNDRGKINRRDLARTFGKI